MNTNTYTTLLETAIADHQRHLRALLKAQAEAARGNMPERTSCGQWSIDSSHANAAYVVGVDGCSCNAGAHHLLCWHTAAVEIARAAEAAEEVDALGHAHVPVWSEKESPGTPYADMGETPPDVCAVDELDAWLTNEMNLPSRVKG